MIRLAVAGGGILGSVIALLAARRGLDVTIIEREPTLWMGASAVNEGKIHLGLIFALGAPYTHEVMLRGALSFAQVIDEAAGRCLDWSRLAGDAFDYVVMPSSLLTAEELLWVYAGINDRLRAREPASYLGTPLDCTVDPTIRRDKTTGLPLFRTYERSVNPRALRDELLAAIAQDPSISVRNATTVTSLRTRDDERVEVAQTDAHGICTTEVFDVAANCTWESQNALAPSDGRAHPLNYRLKAAVRLEPFDGARTVTLVQGPYGDVVRHADHVYASWYPVARLSNEHGRGPSSMALDEASRLAERNELAKQQIDALQRLGFLPSGVRINETMGGFILGHGPLDIDRRTSQLHDRSEFGVHRVGSVLTPRNFKFTTAPLAARNAVEAAVETVGARR